MAEYKDAMEISFMHGLRAGIENAITKAAEIETEKVVNKSIEILREKAAQISASAAIEVHRMVSIQTFGSEVVIRVMFPDKKATP